ncbi:MAG TPA: hypothetical protein VN903_13360, partial [Polyangia bacterium]|nr:hypothetical protein [Polyangia bacterium]
GDGLPELFRGSQELGRWQVMVAGRFSQTPAILPQVAYFSMLEVPMLVEPSNINPTFRPQTFQVFDEDDDGRADLIQTDYKSGRRGFSYSADFSTLKFRYRKTAGTQAFTEQTTSAVAAAAPTWPVTGFDDSPDGTPEGKQGYWHAVDINGDGLKDAIYTTDFAANTPWQIRINTGNGYLPPTSPGPVAATLQTYPKDTAIVPRVCTVACPPAQRKGLDNGLRIADMNGDGRDDLVLLDPLPESTTPTLDPSNYHASTSPIRIAYSNGTGFDAPVALPSHGFGRLWRRQETSGMTQLGDIDGDGLPEVIDLVKDNSVGVARRLLVQYRAMPAGGVDVVFRVDDERGSAEFIEYDNLSAGSAKRLNKNTTDTHVTDLNKPNPVATCKYPARCVSKGTTVRSYINDRLPKHVENLYSYMGARTDATGRGWLGFAQVTQSDRVTNFLRSVRYSQTALESAIVDNGNGAGFTLYPKLGEPSSVSEFYDSGGSPASDLTAPTARPYSITTAALTHTGYPLRLTDRLLTTAVYENSANAANLRRLYTSRSSYDEFGCPLNDSSTSVLIGSGGSSYSTANMYSYRNDASTWLIGLMDRRDETTSTKDDAYGTGCVGTDAAPCATTTLTTEYDFDSRGLTISEAIDPHFNTGIHPLLRVFHRDGAGLITSTDESDMNDSVPVLRTNSSVYDESGVNIKEITNPVGHKTWFQYHPRTSWLFAQADQNGPADKVDLLIKHDRLGRVRELSEDDGRVVTINYGTGVERRAVADGQSTASFVDPNGRLILETWSTFDGTSAVRESQYNSLGAVKKQQYSASTQTHAALSASEQTARTALGSAPIQLSAASYDSLGRPMSATRGQNETTVYAYLTPLGTTSITDGNGNVRELFTDQNGNVRSLKQRVPGTTPRDVVTKYAYQERGLLSLVRTADNARDVLKYDSTGRLLERRAFTASGSSNILNLGRTYSAFGEPSFEYHGGSGSGVTSVQYTRDKIGRVTERKDVTPGTAGEVDSFSWDTSNGIGRLFESRSSAENGNYAHTSRFHYDSLGRVDERREIFGGTLGNETFTFGYTYDGRGRPDTVRYPETASADVFGHPRGGGLTVKYGYKNGQLDFIRDTSKPATDPPLWQAQTRDIFGFVATAKNSANVLSTWQRDPRTLRLGSLVVTSGTTNLVTQGFSYYSNGQLQAHLNGNLDERYTYDALNRLKTYDRTNTAQASQNRISAAFSYDDVGNMTLLDTVTSTGSPDWPAQDETFGFSGTLPNYLQSQTINGTQTTFIPDNMGRVQQHMNSSTGQILRTYAYTTFDLPRTISLPPQNRLAKFEYTGQGERSRKVTTTTGAPTVDVAYVGSLYEQRRSINGTQVTGESVFRIPGETGMIAEITQAWTASALGTRSTRFIHNDHQGSPVASTVGSTVTAAGFLPFG